jgi:hypothetical protein
LHFDILPTWLTPVGAWIFHQARMQSALARHDGTLSAARAHSGATLMRAARDNLPEHACLLFDGDPSGIPLTHVFQCALAIRRPALTPLRTALGDDVHRLSEGA